MKQQRVLTQSGFHKFLSLLDQDKDRAAIRHNELYHSLCRFAEWKGSLFPKEQVDETLDRVYYKLGEGEQIHDVTKYCRKVLHFVLLENLKQPPHDELDESLSFKLKASEQPGENPSLLCLDRCREDLPLDQSNLIIRYYEGEARKKIENRKRLAAELGIAPHTLEVRAARIREKLHPCIVKCLQRQ